MNAWLDLLIKAARAGDDEAARALIGWLAKCLEGGETLPAELAKYFEPALKRIATGSSADTELNLGKHSNWERDYEIATAVWKLNHQSVNHLPLYDNSKKTGAYTIVGKKYGLSADRVKQIYDKMRSLIEAELLDDRPPTDEEARHHAEVQQNLIYAKLVHIQEKQGRK
jgi:hypothetical protein